jgi:hypothetical protein
LTIETEVAVSLLVDFLPLLSVALIVAGWFVIYRNAKKLSTRSETFAIVNRLSNLLEELGQDGTQYWSDTRPVEEYEAKLFLGKCNSNINNIRTLLKILEDRGFVCPSEERLHELFESLTLDCEYRKKSEKCRKKLSDIRSIVDELNNHLLDTFNISYKPS